MMSTIGGIGACQKEAGMARLLMWSSVKVLKMFILLTIVFLYLISAVNHVSGAYSIRSYNLPVVAMINITYRDPVTDEWISEGGEFGRYGFSSRYDAEWGRVVHVRTATNHKHGCTPPVNVPDERWIALIQRGSCTFTDKIHNSAVLKNASAVVIYNNREDNKLITMDHSIYHVVSVFILKRDGERIASLVDNNITVTMYIDVGSQSESEAYIIQINRSPVVCIAVSLTVLGVISLALLVFCVVRRFRHAHTKERLSGRLVDTAKKAISKLPVRKIKLGDVNDDDREIIINTEVEEPSTSMDPTDMLSAEEFDRNSVEVKRSQAAQIDYHNAPVNTRTDDGDDVIGDETGSVPLTDVSFSEGGPRVLALRRTETPA